jgi:hypothetical protein
MPRITMPNCQDEILPWPASRASHGANSTALHACGLLPSATVCQTSTPQSAIQPSSMTGYWTPAQRLMPNVRLTAATTTAAKPYPDSSASSEISTLWSSGKRSAEKAATAGTKSRTCIASDAAKTGSQRSTRISLVVSGSVPSTAPSRDPDNRIDSVRSSISPPEVNRNRTMVAMTGGRNWTGSRSKATNWPWVQTAAPMLAPPSSTSARP